MLIDKRAYPRDVFEIENIPADQPVLIAGPTASGKSSLALRLAETHGGIIVNADALQVYSNWHVLTARPTPKDETRAPHALYGHVAGDTDYSVGHWLRDVMHVLENTSRPIFVGGTGLYFTALTQGLANIPPTPDAIRQEATQIIEERGFEALLQTLDSETRSRIDTQNPMRVQRAWEVQRATGRSIADWQDETPPPLLPMSDICPILIDAPKEWLSPRIEDRFDIMLENGALDEARDNIDHWDKAHPSAKAIGAAELIAHLRGLMTLEAAREAAIIATRQYAKRQRTWFRARMKDWHHIAGAQL